MAAQRSERISTAVRAVCDLSRGRQALLSVVQPAMGALVATRALPSAGVIALGLAAATAGYLAVFSLNDVLDSRIDAAAFEVGKADFDGYDIDTVFLRHPLARGDLSMKASLAWVAGLGLVSAVCAYLLSPVCLMLFAAAVLLEMLYCSLRAVTWSSWEQTSWRSSRHRSIGCSRR